MASVLCQQSALLSVPSAGQGPDATDGNHPKASQIRGNFFHEIGHFQKQVGPAQTDCANRQSMKLPVTQLSCLRAPGELLLPGPDRGNASREQVKTKLSRPRCCVIS